MRSRVGTLFVTLFCAANVVAQEQPAAPKTLPGRGGFFQPGAAGPRTTAPTERATPNEPPARGNLLSPAMLQLRPLPAVIGKLISYEVAIIELIEPAGSSTVPDLSALEKAGKLHSLTRLQLNSAEEQPAFIQFGSLVSRTTGRVATAATVMPMYSDVNLGMIAQVTGRV